MHKQQESIVAVINLFREFIFCPYHARNSCSRLVIGLASGSLLGRLRLRNPQCPTSTENDVASLWVSFRADLVVILKEEVQPFRHDDKVRLEPNGMCGVVR